MYILYFLSSQKTAGHNDFFLEKFHFIFRNASLEARGAQLLVSVQKSNPRIFYINLHYFCLASCKGEIAFK